MAVAAIFLLAGAPFAQPAIEARSGEPPNLDELKQQLLVYRNSGDYERQLAAVAAKAQAYIEQHAGEVPRPALVLDIDETSLSNWPRIVADDFGYIPSGACNRLPKGPCGAKAWELKAGAPAIQPTLMLFNAARAKGVSVFFITGRDESERAATIRNLHRAGYRGWTRLMMKPVGLEREIRGRFQGAGAGEDCGRRLYDHRQHGRSAERSRRRQSRTIVQRQFLLPNPFYRHSLVEIGAQGGDHSPPPAITARVCWSGPKSSAPSIAISSASRVRARLTRDLMVPTAQPQILAASS